jgi:hypothetical protein
LLYYLTAGAATFATATVAGDRPRSAAKAEAAPLVSIKLACQFRSKSIPKNATMREEFVKCKKPNCYRQQHGPYYYAYWKDPETRRLKKKYIGRNYFPMHEQKKLKKK